MRKRILAVLLAVCLAAGLLPTAAFAGGGPEVLVVCVYDQKKLPEGYEVKNPNKRNETYGLVQAVEKIKEDEDMGSHGNIMVIIESDENYTNGAFNWPTEPTDVAILSDLNNLTLYLSGKWTIPENITLDMGWVTLTPIEYLDEMNTQTAITPQEINLFGTVKKPERLNCDVTIHQSAQLIPQSETARLRVPNGVTWTLDNAALNNGIDVYGELKGTGTLGKEVYVQGSGAKLSGQITFLKDEEQSYLNFLTISDGAEVKLEQAQTLSRETSVRDNSSLMFSADMELEGPVIVDPGATLTVAADKSLTISGESPNIPMILLRTNQDNTSNAQLVLQAGSTVFMCPGSISGGTRNGPEIVAPSRPYIAGSGTLRFATSTELKDMTKEDYVQNGLLTWDVSYAVYHRDECAESINQTVNIQHSWDCGGTNHNWIETWTQNPTCVREGYRHTFCPGCGEEHSTRIDPTGHSFPDTPDADGKYTCQNAGCGAVTTDPADPASVTYSVTISASDPNGSVTLSAAAAKRGDTVTITVVPKSGYQAGTPVVKSASGATISVSRTGDNVYTLTMPNGSVTVECAFTAAGTVGVNGGYTEYSAEDRKNRLADGYITIEFGKTGLGEVKANSTYLVQIVSSGQSILFLARSDNTSLRFLCNKTGNLYVWEVPEGTATNIEDLTLSTVQNKQVITGDDIAKLPAYTKN